MRVSFYVFLLYAALAEVLEDGEPLNRYTDSQNGESFLFEFSPLKNLPEKTLSIESIAYSDPHSISMEFRATGTAWASCSTPCIATWLETEIMPDTQYEVRVTCSGPCHFGIVASCQRSIRLADGEPFRGQTRNREARKYRFLTGESPPAELLITILPENEFSYDMEVIESETSDKFPVEESWHLGHKCRISPLKPSTEYIVSVASAGTLIYTLTAATSSSTQTLQDSIPTQGSVEAGQLLHYRVKVDNPEETLVIQLTTFAGTANIFVKFGIKCEEKLNDFELKHSGNGTLTIDKHQRAALGHPTGEYFIGIFGEAHTIFTLMISVNANSWVPLFDGFPQNSYADFNEVNYFYMDLPPAQDLNVTFRVNTINGDPDLYAQLCRFSDTRKCEFTLSMLYAPYDYEGVYSSRRSTGDELIAIAHAGEGCNEGKCRYVIAVVGRTKARTRFTIVGTMDKESEHVMMSGLPMQMTADVPGYLYFKFTVFNSTVTNVTVQLTPIYGDSDLYVTRTSTPSVTNYEKKSTNAQVMVDKIDYVRGEDGETLKDTYHIAVYSNTSASFSILAMEITPSRNVTIQLSPGRSQQDTVYHYEHNNYRIYSFAVHFPDEDQEVISITLAPLSGKYEMYVSNNDQNVDWERGFFYYDWCYCYGPPADQTVILTLEPWHPGYRANGDYSVLVKALEFSQDMSASYRITFSTGSSTVVLQENIPFQDQVAFDMYKTYAFPILAMHEDIRVSVVPVTGDPDVYLSFRETNQKPTKENYDFYHRSPGSEIFSVQWEQGIGNACPKNEKGELLQCTMYISVYGYTASIYSISLAVRFNQPNLLPQGLTATGEMKQAEWRYYFSLVQSDLPLMVELQSLNGNANLYLNVLDYATSGSDMSEFLRPDKEQNHFYSASTWLLESIALQKDHLRDKCESGTCVALTGVYCETLKCTFVLTLRQRVTQELSDEDPKVASIEAHQYAFFVFQNLKAVTRLSITVSPLDSGDPDLFVVHSRVEEFKRKDAQWSSMSLGREHLVITIGDSPFNATKDMKGYYTIGVWAATNCTFSITVSTKEKPVFTIYPRIPVQGRVEHSLPNYYKYTQSENGDLVVRLTPLEGSATLRISLYNETIGDIYDSLPTERQFQWSSEVSGVRNSIQIPQAEHHLYLIGVFSEGSSCKYSLSVTTAFEASLLLNGIPTQGHVRRSEWQYFNFFTSPSSDTDISLTVYEGVANLYMSLSEFVSDTVFNWSRPDSSRHKHIHIDKGKLSEGISLIGVYGVESSKFALTAHNRDKFVTLVDGWPQSYSIMYDNKDHLYFQYPVRTSLISKIECQVKSYSPNFWPSVVVTFSNNSNEFPSADSVGTRYEDFQYEHIFQTLTFTLLYQGVGVYTLAVFGKSWTGASSDELGTFEMSCSGQTNFTVLRSGTVVVGRLDANRKKDRFEVYAPEQSTLQAIVILCRGKAELSVSSNYTMYTTSGFDISVSRPVDGRIVATILGALGEYYLTVSSETTEVTEYQLSVVLTPSSVSIANTVTPGNDGVLDWTIVERRTVQLTWSPAVYENGNPISSVKYHVFATDNPEVKFNSICSVYEALQSGQAWTVMTDISEVTQCSFTVKQERIVIVNVVAVADGWPNPLLGTVPYTPTEVLVRGREKGTSLVWLFILLAALSLALIFTAVYHFKIRKAKQRLFHELTVVREGAKSADETMDIELPQQHTPKPYTSAQAQQGNE